jgi:hypothetical protein
LYACNSSYSGGGDRERTSSRPVRAKLVRPYVKNKTKAKGLGVQFNGKVLKYESLGLIPITARKKKN